jgi:2-deoxy-D-gluconate 3-dehydrogenase
MFDLQKRVAFVTGGNGGIGLGMAKGLASAGASVAIAGRNKTKAQSALSELRALGGQAEFIDLDALDENSCRHAVQHAADRSGRLDILVNNAGTTVRKQPQDLTAGTGAWYGYEFDQRFLCSQATYPHMVRFGGGKDHQHRISMTIFHLRMRHLTRRAKAASCNGARWLSRGREHPVNAILPGWIDTDLTRKPRAGQGLTKGAYSGNVGAPDDFASPFSRVTGIEFRHRGSHSGRWRIFGAAIGPAAAVKTACRQ